jgi:hypothetical protein
MKRLNFIYLLLFMFSCDLINSENPNNNSQSPEQGQTGSDLWKVALFVDDGFDFTRNFEDVRFNFADAGVFEANKKEEVITGRWRIERDSPLDELYITFPKSSVLSELNDDWYIRERNDNFISLEYRDEGKTDRLIFVREGDQRTIEAPFEGRKTDMENLFSEIFGSDFEITSLIDDKDNKTALFKDATLAFDKLGRIILSIPGRDPWKGSWKVGFNDKNVLLDIDFDYSSLPDYLDEDWILTSKNDGRFNFKEKDNKPEDFLELKKK